MRRCAGKERLDTREEATGRKVALALAKGVPPSKLCAYHCDQCLGYHVGGATNHFISRQRYRGRRGVKRANRNRRGRQ